MKIEKEHSYKTLMSWTKEELVQHIINLEHNVNSMQERLDRQANNIHVLLKMKDVEQENFMTNLQAKLSDMKMFRPSEIDVHGMEHCKVVIDTICNVEQIIADIKKKGESYEK